MKCAEAKSVDEYIAATTEQQQEILHKLRALVFECVPKVEEKIAYRMPTYTLSGNVVVHFHAGTKHLGFYPEADGVEHFREKLVEYETAKGAIRFPYKREIPYELIEEIIRFKARQAAAKCVCI